LIHFPKKPNA